MTFELILGIPSSYFFLKAGDLINFFGDNALMGGYNLYFKRFIL